MKNIFHMMKYISNLKLASKLEPELPTLYYKKDGLFNDTVTGLEQLQTPILTNSPKNSKGLRRLYVIYSLPIRVLRILVSQISYVILIY